MTMLTAVIIAKKTMGVQPWFGMKRNYIEKNISQYVSIALIKFIYNIAKKKKMVSPQKDNGFTPIATEIVEALMMVNLSGNEGRILWFIFRKTYGFNKKTDWLTLGQFSKALFWDRRLVHRGIKKLKRKNMLVIQTDDSGKIRYGFQKDYEKWKVSSIEMTRLSSVSMTWADKRNNNNRLDGKEAVIQTDDKKPLPVIQTDDGVSSKLIPTIETLTKETTKEKDLIEFDFFWKAYPRKIGKRTALKTWQKLKPPIEIVLTTIEKAKKSKDWLKDGGQYIPHPATWLNRAGWEDEYEQEGTSDESSGWLDEQ